MRNKPKTTGGDREGRFLAALARRLRDWLDKYLSEDATHAADDSRADGDGLVPACTAEQQESVPRPGPQADADPLEHWLNLVRTNAPELLIPPEQGGTPWQCAEQPAPPTPDPRAAPEQDQTQSATSPQVNQVNNDIEVASTPPSQPPSNIAPPHDQQPLPRGENTTNMATAAPQQPAANIAPRQHQQPLPASDGAANAETRVQPPASAPPLVEGRRTAPQAARIAKDEVLRSEARPTRASVQDGVEDARLSRTASAPGTEHKTNFGDQHCDSPPARKTVTAPSRLRTVLEPIARVRDLLLGSAKSESENTRPQTNLVSSPAFSISRDRKRRPKEEASFTPPAVSRLRQQTPAQAERRADRAGFERNNTEVQPPQPALPQSVKPQPPAIGSAEAKSTPPPSFQMSRRVSSQSSPDLWPDLPNRLREDIANMQFLEQREHGQALDLEQQGDIAEASATARPQPAKPELSGDWWPWTDEGAAVKAAAASGRATGRGPFRAHSERWPDLPAVSREHVESVQILRRLEHVQLLDNEQQGAI